MKIFDCFIFFNELELLELRFMELYDVVDYFVIVEANQTHTGKPKEFIFEKNKDRYAKYLGKVIHVKVEDCPMYSLDNVAIIEHFQRNAIMRGLDGVACKDDKILISDMDEIPSPEAIKANISNPDWIYFDQALFYYYVNCQVKKSCGGSVMATYGTFSSPQSLRRFAKRRYRALPSIREDIFFNGGWHYSYLTGGDIDRIKYKVENIFESSGILNLIGTKEDIAKKVASQKDLYGRTRDRHEMSIVDISKTKPRSMDKFLEKYPQFFYKET